MSRIAPALFGRALFVLIRSFNGSFHFEDTQSHHDDVLLRERYTNVQPIKLAIAFLAYNKPLSFVG
jgi:hypothetical protein